MELYNNIIQQVENLKLKDESISQIAHTYGFDILNTDDISSAIPGERYTIFKAIKRFDLYIIELQIDTKDKYSSFGNDEEPYFNEIRLLKGTELIDHKEYIYFK